MGKSSVAHSGSAGHEIYTKESFSLPDAKKCEVLLPGGHVFSDFVCLELLLYSGASVTVECLKTSDTTIAVGVLDNRTSTKSYRVEKDIPFISGATKLYPGDTYDVKPISPYSVIHALGVLK